MCGIYCHERGGTEWKVEPEFPDPFLCLSLCRQANTSQMTARAPAPGEKKRRERERERKKAMELDC